MSTPRRRRRWTISRYLWDLRFRRPKVYARAMPILRILSVVGIVTLCEFFADMSWYLLTGWVRKSECEDPTGVYYGMPLNHACEHYLPKHWWAYHPIDGWDLFITQLMGVILIVLGYAVVRIVRDYRQDPGW